MYSLVVGAKTMRYTDLYFGFCVRYIIQVALMCNKIQKQGGAHVVST